MAWVVSAVSSIGAAFTAGAAVIGGAAVTAATVATIAAGVANAGIVLSIVGKVTKSKELMKIGGVMAVAGGVASLGASAYGAMTGGTAAATSVDGAATNIGADAAVNQAAPAILDTAETFPVSDPSALVTTPTPSLADSAASWNPASSDIALDSVPQASGATPAYAPASTEANMSVDPSGSRGLIAGVQDASANYVKPGFLESAGNWYKNLPDAEKSRIHNQILQAGGKAIGGMFEGWSADKKLELEREVMAENQRRYDNTRANGNAIPTIAFKPAPTGLVKSARGGGG